MVLAYNILPSGIQWWPGDTKSQGISSHGIDLVILEYSSFSTRWVNIQLLTILKKSKRLTGDIWYKRSYQLPMKFDGMGWGGGMAYFSIISWYLWTIFLFLEFIYPAKIPAAISQVYGWPFWYRVETQVIKKVYQQGCGLYRDVLWGWLWKDRSSSQCKHSFMVFVNYFPNQSLYQRLSARLQ